jgi:hypothetical protein
MRLVPAPVNIEKISKRNMASFSPGYQRTW